MYFSIFDSSACQLGESAFWCAGRGSFLWLDILAKTLFEKCDLGEVRKHSFSFTPSVIVQSSEPDCVTLVTDQGLATYNLQSSQVESFTAYDLGSGFRSNDAGLDPQGRVVFGSMEWEPTGCNGAVYRFDARKGLEKLISGVGIPNTFAWSTDGLELYMADSYRQEMYAFDYSAEVPLKKRVLFNLSASGATPDGSTMFRGKLLNAEWDGAKVAVRSPLSGELFGELPLPVPRPTSCVVGGEKMDKLLVTTASVDLTDAQQEQYPLSGQTFIANIKDLEMAGVI